MINKRIFALGLLFLLFVVVLIQFISSNFGSLIGRNYTPGFALSSYNNYEISKNPDQNGVSCQFAFGTYPASLSSTRGFPFATNEVYDTCQEGYITTSGFQTLNPDRILNISYIVSITAATYLLFRRFKRIN